MVGRKAEPLPTGAATTRGLAGPILRSIDSGLEVVPCASPKGSNGATTGGASLRGSGRERLGCVGAVGAEDEVVAIETWTGAGGGGAGWGNGGGSSRESLMGPVGRTSGCRMGIAISAMTRAACVVKEMSAGQRLWLRRRGVD